jgi:hypothetical protein
MAARQPYKPVKLIPAPFQICPIFRRGLFGQRADDFHIEMLVPGVEAGNIRLDRGAAHPYALICHAVSFAFR